MNFLYLAEDYPYSKVHHQLCKHIVDLGKDGGDNGGTLVASGTPEQIAKCEESYTGEFLRKML